jgi:hypothetical protein
MSKIKTFIEFGSPAYKTIEKYVRNMLATPDAEGIMRIESNQVVTKAAQDLAAQFNSYGVPPSVITKTDDVRTFAGQIANIEQQKMMQAIKKQITPKKSADIVELQTGKKIDQSKGIIGGRQFEETEDQIKARIDKQNKETIARIKMVDDAIDDASTGFSGDRKIDAELVAENLAQRRGLVYDDLSTRERAKIYGEAFDALSKKFRDDLATGGRVGLKNGMSRRKFMQIMGGLAALPVVGKFFKTGKVAAPVVEKAAEAASGAPSYFFDLVNKIKIFGKEGRSISPRKKTTTYKNYELEEDLTTGDLTVVKQKGDPDFAYEEEVMVLRKGQADETTKGKTPPDEYEELTVRPDGDGKMKDVDSGIEPEGIKEIIEEVSGEAPSIKKAGGGIARMLGE